MIRVVTISDTHTGHRQLDVPDGDLLIHAGDILNVMQNKAGLAELQDFAEWADSLPHALKFTIAGNHDWIFQEHPEVAQGLFQGSCHYLQDQMVTVDLREEFSDPGAFLNIYGSPWQPEFGQLAFNMPRGESLARVWSHIPDETDLLVTHGPPHGHQDWVGPRRTSRQGCKELRKRVDKVRPVAHVFGHIHRGRGYTQANGTRFVNAAVVNGRYEVVHEPTVLLLDREDGKWVCRFCGPVGVLEDET